MVGTIAAIATYRPYDRRENVHWPGPPEEKKGGDCKLAMIAFTIVIVIQLTLLWFFVLKEPTRDETPGTGGYGGGDNTTYIYLSAQNNGSQGTWVDFEINGTILCHEFIEVTGYYGCEMLNETGANGTYNIEIDHDDDASPEWRDIIELEAGEKFWYNHTITE